jgi:Cu/Ag efflux protein CusF
VAVNRTYFDFAIIVTLLFTIILSMLSPALAYDDQQQAFANQTTMAENQINNNDKPANGNSNSTIPKVDQTEIKNGLMFFQKLGNKSKMKSLKRP